MLLLSAGERIVIFSWTRGFCYFFLLFTPDLYFFVSCSLSVSFQLFDQKKKFQKYSFYLLRCTLLFVVYQCLIYPIIVSDQDQCGRTRDIVLFITHILQQCLNLLLTLTTMQCEHLQCSQRFGRFMQVAANVASSGDEQLLNTRPQEERQL